MELPLGTIIKGDALTVGKRLPTASVQCIVTSPPYWNLRDYQIGGESLAGQMGQEPTIEEHLAALVEVFREYRRVLRPDATLWLNYGDAYSGAGYSNHANTGGAQRSQGGKQKHTKGPDQIGPKNLLMLPARVAMALQADGWTLRSDIIWSKPNPMPESVTDRPATAHEHMFLLTPGPKYYYDAEAVRERAEYGRREWKGEHLKGGDIAKRHGGTTNGGDPSGGRNLRNVWTVPTQAYSGAHYATFPERLVEPCIKAGASEKGACPACGAPWRRVVEKLPGEKTGGHKGRGFGGVDGMTDMSGYTPMRQIVNTLGWNPGCECGGDPVPCVVLDPFAGSGTVGVVAAKLGREFVGVDLAGGDADLGGHTAHDRINAARGEGAPVADMMRAKEAGQTDIFGGDHV